MVYGWSINSLTVYKSKILNNNVKALFVDYEANVWVGTEEDGLFLLPFTLIQAFSYTNFNANSIAPIKDGMLLGLQDGSVLIAKMVVLKI